MNRAALLGILEPVPRLTWKEKETIADAIMVLAEGDKGERREVEVPEDCVGCPLDGRCACHYRESRECEALWTAMRAYLGQPSPQPQPKGVPVYGVTFEGRVHLSLVPFDDAYPKLVGYLLPPGGV